MKCENCKLDLSTNNKFLKGITNDTEKGYMVSIVCPHCWMYQFITIEGYWKFCCERIESFME